MSGVEIANKTVTKKNNYSSILTIVIPTRNRPAHCAAQLRFFRDCGVRYRIVVADSSDSPKAKSVRTACKGIADYRYFDPQTRVFDKWAAVVGTIDTPYVVMTPDDDITFPHAIDAALDALRENEDYVAAHGYVLRFGMHDNIFDIHSVYSFTPTIGEDDPLRRHYQLMRRYQPFIWAVFRTAAFTAALQRAAEVDGAIFQEITFMNIAVLQGKVMRLPLVYAMRGSEESLVPLAEVNPFFWFLKDAGLFFGHYLAYRNRLAQTIRAMNIPIPDDAKLEQLLDIVHGTWLGRAVDVGMINHTARQLLGDGLPAIYVAPQWPGWRPPERSDLVHVSRKNRREYVWREAVVAAEPRTEIAIGADEMANVERQLDVYGMTSDPGS